MDIFKGGGSADNFIKRTVLLICHKNCPGLLDKSLF